MQKGGYIHKEPITLIDDPYRGPQINSEYQVNWISKDKKLQRNNKAPIKSSVPDLINLMPLPYLSVYLYKKNILDYVLLDKDNYVLLESIGSTRTGSTKMFKLTDDYRIEQIKTLPIRMIIFKIEEDYGRYMFKDTPDYVGEIDDTIYFNANNLIRNVYNNTGEHNQCKDFIRWLFTTEDFKPRQNNNAVNKLMFCNLLHYVTPVNPLTELVTKTEMHVVSLKNKLTVPLIGKSMSYIWKNMNTFINTFHDYDTVTKIRHIMGYTVKGDDLNRYMAVMSVKLYNHFYTTLLPYQDKLAHTQNITNIYSKIQTLQTNVNKNLIKASNIELNKSLEECYQQFIADIVSLMCHKYEIHIFSKTLNIDIDLFTHIINIYCLQRLKINDIMLPIHPVNFLQTYFNLKSFEQAPSVMNTETLHLRLGKYQTKIKRDNLSMKAKYYTLYSLKNSDPEQGMYCPVADWSFSHMGKRIPDCGEKTTLNILNRLIWNIKDIDINKLPISTISQCRHFYEKYPSLKAQLDTNASLFAGDWASVVSGIPGVRYIRKLHEIVPTKNNIISVLTHLLGINPLNYYETSVTSQTFNSLEIDDTTTFYFSSQHGWTDHKDTGNKDQSDALYILETLSEYEYDYSPNLDNLLLHVHKSPFQAFILHGESNNDWKWLGKISYQDDKLGLEVKYYFEIIEDFGINLLDSVFRHRMTGDSHFIFLMLSRYAWGIKFIHRIILDYPGLRQLINMKLNSIVNIFGINGVLIRKTTAVEAAIDKEFAHRLNLLSMD
uniref:Uncharacterized protein n=1 Tax=viral metagenome TaxID=1070528 RepID=A0A6C0J7H7_9ZZZZ